MFMKAPRYIEAYFFGRLTTKTCTAGRENNSFVVFQSMTQHRLTPWEGGAGAGRRALAGSAAGVRVLRLEAV